MTATDPEVLEAPPEDELDAYLAAPLRVVVVGATPPDDSLLDGLCTTDALHLDPPADDDLVTWHHLVDELAPQVLVMDRPEVLRFERVSSPRVLAAATAYQWMTVGRRATLVIWGCPISGIQERRRVGALARGLLNIP